MLTIPVQSARSLRISRALGLATLLVLRCKPSGRARCSEDGRSRVPVESDLGGGGVPFRRISLELGTERAG